MWNVNIKLFEIKIYDDIIEFFQTKTYPWTEWIVAF